MKSFREHATKLHVIVPGLVMLTAMAAWGTAVHWSDAKFLLGGGSSLTRWLSDIEAGSPVDAALYRLMQLPGGVIQYRRSPRETRPALSDLLKEGQKNAALYSLRALEEEQGLDFDAAVRDWKSWVGAADDKVAANLDLADFYDRRLNPQAELAALEAAGNAPASEHERWTAAEQQRSWKAWDRAQHVVKQFALPHELSTREFMAWERRYPEEKAIYERELAALLADKDYVTAADLISRYRKVFAGDHVFSVKAEADIAAQQGSTAGALAVYERSFEPLWPTELVVSYHALLVRTRTERKVSDDLRARIAANPDDLNDTVRLFYINQQQGQLDPAKAVLADYRKRKDEHGTPWKPDQLYTLGRLLESVQDFPEAARYYYALAAMSNIPAQQEKGNSAPMADAEQEGLAGLTRVLLTAPEQPLRVGAGNLALYESVATMDRGPGYLNGILSLLLNSESPRSEMNQQNQLAIPYFHRARAAELLATLDKRYPEAPGRAALHADLLEAYAAYGENGEVIREGNAYLAQFTKAEGRVSVALQVADAYSRTSQPDKEFALYQDLLKELALRADGIPIGVQGPAYSKQVAVTAQSMPLVSTAAEGQETQTPTTTPAPGARSAEYAQVLDRYLSRLVSLQRLPDALAVLRGELDRNPQDPGLYERLADFLEQNSLNEKQEAVYQQAMQQFQDTGWYAKLARFYLRQKRNSDYSALSRKVAQAFSGTELETYLREAPAPDRRLALEVNRYAHQRFPHDLTFVQNLLDEYLHLGQQQEAEALLWQHWSESPLLRDQLFQLLSRTGRLDAELAALKQQAPEIDKADWTSLAQRNPAAERFWMELCQWQSHFEQALGASGALAFEYPADQVLDGQASSLYRSLAYFHPEYTDQAAAIEKRLLAVDPGDLNALARIGDIYADQNRFEDAAPYWAKMAQVRPGDENGYLQSATVFWDYFDFSNALTQLHAGRDRAGKPALFGYQAGAIEESRGNLSNALREYLASALDAEPSVESRDRLLALAQRASTRDQVDTTTAELVKSATPDVAAIELRVSVLDAEHRKDELSQELIQIVARTESFDVLDAVNAAATSHMLNDVQQAALRRQIALTTDPVRNLQIRYQLVDLYQKRDAAAAARELDAIYREHGKVLGVVRATVDYDWAHERKPQAVTALLESAQAAYPQLKSQLQLEAARKLTELGEYARSRALLAALLQASPMDPAYEAAMASNYATAGDQASLDSFYRERLKLVQASSLAHADKQERLAILRRGMILAATKLHNAVEAVDQYVELINAYPDDAALTQEAARYAVAHGAKEKLLSFYEKTVETSPHDVRWAIVLARLETAAEDFPAALSAYAKAVALRPERQDLLTARVDLEERLQRYDDAAIDYGKLYQLTYHDPQWMEKVAETRARQGRNVEAVKALQAGFIDGRPAKASNFFEVASRLEQWGMLDEARHFAEQGVHEAGADLLVDTPTQTGAATYARVMTRLRQADAAYAQLLMSREQAGKTTLTAIAAQVAKTGPGAITDEEWRKQRETERTAAATEGFASAVKAMAQIAGENYTPEEKADFAAWLHSKADTASIDDVRRVYIAAAQSAGFADLESELRWALIQKNTRLRMTDIPVWIQLQQNRLQMESAGPALERVAAAAPAKQKAELWKETADVYRKTGDISSELRVTQNLANTSTLKGDRLTRYYQLLLAQRPDELLRLASSDSAAQYAIEHGTAAQALAAVAARSATLPSVWRAAFTGLTGLYQQQHAAQINEGFTNALGDVTIGERIAHPLDRTQQLAGEVWFYYASRYGEYLDEVRDARAQSYLESELEHTPENPSAYVALADYTNTNARATDALVDYQHSLELMADQPAVLDKIATIQWEQGQKEQALNAWNQAVKHLSAEIDAKRVPESFWGDFAQVLESIHAHHQYPAVRDQVDQLLRVYLARNGVYRLIPLLEAGYHANDNSMQWLLQITVSATDPLEVLTSLDRELSAQPAQSNTNWLEPGQQSALLGRIVQLERQRTADHPDQEPSDETGHASRWLQALLDEGKSAEAHVEFARLTNEKKQSAQWLPVTLRITEADGRLLPLLAEWSSHDSLTPSASDLRSASGTLSEKGKRAVLRFVYQRALNAQELTAPNFLGLAAIDLDEGDVSSAMALLKRLALVGTDMYPDLDSAAKLLEDRHNNAEAIEFLKPLTVALPWRADYKVRLATAMFAVDPHSAEAASEAQALVADPRAPYDARVNAALALRGHGTANAGSAELSLLMLGNCPTAEAVSKPYFVQARMRAAACASSSATQERLLHDAISIAPDTTQLRLQYTWSAFASGRIARALLAAEPFLQSWPSYSQFDNRDDQTDEASSSTDTPEADGGQSNISSSAMKPGDRVKLYLLAISALDRQHDTRQALNLAEQASEAIPAGSSAKQFRELRTQLNLELARQQENASRAPKVHAQLDQDRIVRPKLMPKARTDASHKSAGEALQ